MRTTNTVERPQEIYQIKVTLLGTDPPIWRQLLVPAALILEQLHHVLQLAMGWEDSHMHEFRIGQQRFGKPDPMERALGGPRTASERMTSAIAGNIKSSWRNASHPNRGALTLPAWPVNDTGRPKTVAVYQGSTTCWKRSAPRSMSSTRSSWSGWAMASIQRPFQSTKSIGNLRPLQRPRSKAAAGKK